MKNIIKINFIILVICVLLTVTVFAEDNIQENQEQSNVAENTLDSLNVQKSDLENQIQQKESEIQYIQEDMSATLLELENLSQEIADKQNEIAEIELQEIELNKYIETTEVELTSLKEKYAKQKKALEARLVAMYKFGNASYLDVLLNSKSLSQFLSNCYYLTIITKTDTNLLKSVEEKITIEGLLCKLPEEQRECIILYYMQELTYREISQILKIPIPTAKSRVQRGLKACKKILEENHGSI